jgi:hypothetical protein
MWSKLFILWNSFLYEYSFFTGLQNQINCINETWYKHRPSYLVMLFTSCKGLFAGLSSWSPWLKSRAVLLWLKTLFDRFIPVYFCIPSIHNHIHNQAWLYNCTWRLVSAMKVSYNQPLYKLMKMFTKTLCNLRLEISLSLSLFK